MKLRTSLTTIVVAFLLCCNGLYSNNGVDVRFSAPIIDHSTQTAFVDIQVKSEYKALSLAGQNYRIYYNTEMLSLNTDKTELNLPADKYTPIAFHSTIEGIDATGAGALSFDDNLGFANFSIDLTDQVNGGIIVSDGDDWITVATLGFDMTSDADELYLVWGREEMSEDYATAYVEMAEWVAPKKIQSLLVNEYTDLSYSKDNELSAIELVSFDFGPNPTSEYVNIRFDKALSADAEIRFIDMKGVVSKRIDIDAGTPKLQVNITDMVAGNYVIEIDSDTDRVVSGNKLSILN